MRYWKVSKQVSAKIDYLITPGGFWSDCPLPMDLYEYKLEEIENDNKFFDIVVKPLVQEYVNEDFSEIFYKSKLKKVAKYISFGFDLFTSDDDDNCIEKLYRLELVLLYDLINKRLVNITGKFYPTNKEQNKVIKLKDFDMKFLQIGDDKILILGCHDLNVFNPWGQANLRKGSDKYKISQEFYKRFEREKPSIILHHPHTTDTPNIWRLAWTTIRKEYPFVEHFASGILHANELGVARGELDKVLEVTKKGAVLDIIV